MLNSGNLETIPLSVVHYLVKHAIISCNTSIKLLIVEDLVQDSFVEF